MILSLPRFSSCQNTSVRDCLPGTRSSTWLIAGLVSQLDAGRHGAGSSACPTEPCTLKILNTCVRSKRLLGAWENSSQVSGPGFPAQGGRCTFVSAAGPTAFGRKAGPRDVYVMGCFLCRMWAHRTANALLKMSRPSTETMCMTVNQEGRR